MRKRGKAIIIIDKNYIESMNNNSSRNSHDMELGVNVDEEC